MALLAGCEDFDTGSMFGGIRGGSGPAFEARDVDEVIAIGGARLTGDEISAQLSGATLVEPNEDWTWNINADGSQAAFSNEPDWADDPNGTWAVEGDQFCRENVDLAQRCSDVYQIGSVYRFTGEGGGLEPWAVVKQ